MANTTEIEKENLEAHVELCAERYKSLEDKLDTVEEKVDHLEEVVFEIRDSLNDMNNRRSSQLLTWGGSIIAALLGACAWLIAKTYL
jgi:phage shock protein A